ncbi:MAG TPA: TIGR03435 family protein [Acidobacteriaceae bacterium]|jgi:uncharacterized protein (TIGR03435 family)
MRTLILGSAVLAFVGLAVLPQQVGDSFEVASIRPNTSENSNTQITLPKGGRYVVVNATVKTLLRNAYGLLSFQFAGGPSWLDTDRYDINAKANSSEDLTLESTRPLLQNLLADRFHMKVHWETREAPIYVLVADKGGPKFQAHSDAPGHGMNTRKTSIAVQMKGTDVPMEELASNLGNQLGRFTVDETGLHGHYDFVLNWAPDPTADSSLPSLFTAVREQLGLRLESRKGPMKVLVIDQAEKPSEN